MKKPEEIEFCNIPERTEENWGVAFASDLMKERMNAAREYSRMCYEGDNIDPHKHAADFECGSMWGESTVRHMTVRWLKENFPKTVEEFEKLNWEEFIKKYLYDVQ